MQENYPKFSVEPEAVPAAKRKERFEISLFVFPTLNYITVPFLLNSIPVAS